MAKVIGDICAATGKYIRDGEEKTSWSKCGILLETEKGFRIKLDTVPLGGVEQGIWFSVFPKEDRRQGTAPQAASQPTQAAQQPIGIDDDIPF